MKVGCVADLHGFLPDIPPCDILLIAGDLTWHDSLWKAQRWFDIEFRQWCKKFNKPIYLTLGNHDEIGEYPFLLEGLFESNVTLLIDQVAEYIGLKLFGSPWTKTFNQWHFMKDEEDLEQHFNRVIPSNADIWIMHSPPFGVGDMVFDYDSRGNHIVRYIGSPVLLKKIEKYQPKLVVFGHNHTPEITKAGNTTVANVAHVDEDYKPRWPIQVFDILLKT